LISNTQKNKILKYNQSFIEQLLTFSFYGRSRRRRNIKIDPERLISINKIKNVIYLHQHMFGSGGVAFFYYKNSSGVIIDVILAVSEKRKDNVYIWEKYLPDGFSADLNH
jgi:hypothetical protein